MPTSKDLNAEVSAWYFHSTPIWLIVMGIASIIYFKQISNLKKQGKDLGSLFSELLAE